MGRLPGVQPSEAGWFVRLLYTFARRKIKQVTGRSALPAPVKVHAHHPRLLVAMAQMEMGQEAARAVPVRLKTLAAVRAAMLIGCPY